MISALTGTLQLIATIGLCEPVMDFSIYRLDTAVIKKTTDFPITGSGGNAAWNKTSWQQFTRLDSGGKNYDSKSKMLYSERGIYLLFTGEDERISTENYQDDEEIYEGDVFEFFLQSDPRQRSYFEYEINQLDKQLILVLTGSPHRNLAWSPWGYEYKKDPLIQKKVALSGGAKMEIKPGASIRHWSAEIFFPWEILGLLPGTPPESGMVWRANFCRIDYDSGKMIQWSWSKNIKKSFHELENFGFILFE